MSNLTSLHGPRPVATAPTGDAYRIQPGRLVTFAGFVRPSAVARTEAEPEARSEAAKRAA
jgi:hypothetical protein